MKSNQNQNQILDIFERAKRAKNIEDIAKQYGYNVQNHRCVSFTNDSPEHHSESVQFNLSDNTCYDHKGEGGGKLYDAVELLYTLQGGLKSRYEIAKELVGEDEHNASYYKQRKSQLEILREELKFAHAKIWHDKEILEYFYSRGLDDDDIQKNQNGVMSVYMGKDQNGASIFEDRITCPIFNSSGEIIYLITRAINSRAKFLNEKGEPLKYKKLYTGEGGKFSNLKNALLGYETIPTREKDRNKMCICEGVFDFYSFKKAGIPCLCFAGGNPGKENTPEMILTSKTFEDVFLCFDNDFLSKTNTGEQFTYKIARLLLRNNVLFNAVRHYGEKNKDVSDYFSRGGDLQDLLNTAENGVTFTIKMFDKAEPKKKAIDRERLLPKLREFYTELRRACKFDGDLTIQVKNLLQNLYTPEILQEISREETQTEKIKRLTAEFLNDKEIIATGTARHESFFAYDTVGGYWRRKDISDMYHDINFAFNLAFDEKTYTAVARETHVQKKHESDKKINWNAFNGFNFKNGVFDYATGKLKSHAKEYFSLHCADFDYTAEAVNKDFEKFICEIAGYNASRIQTIRDMLGHILIADKAKSQFFFCLIGKGSNGKSTLAKIIEAVFGGENGNFVTGVYPNKLGVPTERMRLMNSLINYRADCPEKIDNEACAQIKSITGGDTISGNYKFFDTLEFRPRCTLIFSFNAMPTFRDTTFGFKRRIRFINFTQDFLGKTDDKDLSDRILKDKAGIFNYIYQCYLDLKANNFEVRECVDQPGMMKDFELENNIVAQFLDDFFETKKDFEEFSVAKPDFYKQYILFCDETKVREQYLSKTKFYAKINELRPNCQRHKNTGDYFVFRLQERTETKQAEKILEHEMTFEELSEKIKGNKTAQNILAEFLEEHGKTKEDMQIFRQKISDETAPKIVEKYMSFLSGTEKQKYETLLAGYRVLSEILKRGKQTA